MERRERKNAVTVLAPAKLNLALDVVGLLPNGYHALDMTMQTITLYERVMLRRSAGLSLRLPGSLVQPNDKNTAIKAALAFFRTLPLTKYTVLVCEFANWADTAPLPCFVIKN